MIRLEQEVPKTANIIDLSQFGVSTAVTSSDGCCAKYADGLSWVKLDRTGYEALAETISSRVARALGLYTVDYRLCFCKIDNLFYTGCISQSFLKDNYEETTLGRLLCNELHCCNLTELMKRINQFQTPSERIHFVTSVLSKYIDEEELLSYLAEVLWLDSLVYNGDRHLYNISSISYVKGLLKSLEVYQSNIFPGADLQYIQLEFYKGQSYLELQIYCDHCVLFQTGRELSDDIFKTLNYDKSRYWIVSKSSLAVGDDNLLKPKYIEYTSRIVERMVGPLLAKGKIRTLTYVDTELHKICSKRLSRHT